jgi:hypothetical protein
VNFIRFVLSALGALWLLSGILSLGVIAKMPPDPEDTPPDSDAAVRLVLAVWSLISVILMGPIGLHSFVMLRDERLRKIAADNRKSRLQGGGS